MTDPGSLNRQKVGSDKACFAGTETVTLESGESKFLSDVRVGDRILSSDAAGQTSFSDVVFVPHGANSDKANFAHITTAEGRDLKMTPNHVIPAGVCGGSALSSLPLIYASQGRSESYYHRIYDFLHYCQPFLHVDL